MTERPGGHCDKYMMHETVARMVVKVFTVTRVLNEGGCSCEYLVEAKTMTNGRADTKISTLLTDERACCNQYPKIRFLGKFLHQGLSISRPRPGMNLREA